VFVVHCIGSSLCDELITTYQVFMCVCLIVCELGTSTMWQPKPNLGCGTTHMRIHTPKHAHTHTHTHTQK